MHARRATPGADPVPWPPAVLDLEASGFGRDSYPIEVGLVLPDGRTWCSLIRPEPDWTHWDVHAADLHGLTPDQLHRHGRSPHDVARILNSWLDGQAVYTDAWAHDYPWLHRLYHAAGLPPRFRLLSAQEWLGEDGLDGWDRTRRAMADVLRAPRHRASNDARVVQATLAALGLPAGPGRPDHRN